MATTCSRIGCSEDAVARVGVDASALLLVLDGRVDEPGGAAVLCGKHLARLIAPRGWWIDDRRTPTPALFRSASTGGVAPTAGRSRRRGASGRN